MADEERWQRIHKGLNDFVWRYEGDNCAMEGPDDEGWCYVEGDDGESVDALEDLAGELQVDNLSGTAATLLMGPRQDPRDGAGDRGASCRGRHRPHGGVEGES